VKYICSVSFPKARKLVESRNPVLGAPFSDTVKEKLNFVSNNFTNAEELIIQFTSTLHSIAESTIITTSPSPKHTYKPWFDGNCKQAVKTQGCA
jgi:hypothetical protein